MKAELALKPEDPGTLAVSPLRELGAYEVLWEDPKATFKSISAKFADHPGALPSDFVSPKRAQEVGDIVRRHLNASDIGKFGVRVHGAGEYPEKLRDAAYPVELLYYSGWWDLVSSRCVAVVGTRKPSEEGQARAKRIVRELVRDDFTIVSGLAA